MIDHYVIWITVSWWCLSNFHLVFVVCVAAWAQQAAPAPACMRRPFPSKWCRAQHTAPHLAAYSGPGLTAQHKRLDIRTCCFLHIQLLHFFVDFIVISLFVQAVCEEEKEVYRQLLTMVSCGQSSCLHNGSSHAIVRSHRDLYVSIQVQNTLKMLESDC